MGWDAHGETHELESALGKVIDKLKKDVADLKKRVKKLEEGS